MIDDMVTFPVSTLAKLDASVDLEDPDASWVSAVTCGTATCRDASLIMTVMEAAGAGLCGWMPTDSCRSVISEPWLDPFLRQSPVMPCLGACSNAYGGRHHLVSMLEDVVTHALNMTFQN